MDAEAFVLALLDALPKKEIRGRKRLQKLAFFAKAAGAPVETDFFLHDFGPYSPAIASATQFLTLLGDLKEQDVSMGRLNKFVKLYTLNQSVSISPRLTDEVRETLLILDSYSTIELEIASTLEFFRSKGYEWDKAVAATKQLKPAKSERNILARARQAIAQVGLDERRRTN